jgi:Fe-S cluster assembly ATP-binding protein
MLIVNNLTVTSKNNDLILNKLNLSINKGSVHAIMGANGSGKSTLCQVLAGNNQYKVVNGSILFDKENIIDISPEERSWKGLFVSFQSPIEFAGLNMMYYLRMIFNNKLKANNLPEITASTFLKLLTEKIKFLNIDKNFLSRSLNYDFSGGEKKRSELLQLILLEPKLAVLDELDSGLDVDGLLLYNKTIEFLRSKNCTIIIISHHQKLISDIKPDNVHILHKGTIIKSGSIELSVEINKKGYNEF